ncbi:MULTISPECIES: hypothetical protein [Bacillus]|nr:hypothetical protein [Bacillus cereus]
MNELKTAEKIMEARQNSSNEERWKLLDKMYDEYYNTTSNEAPIDY